MKNIIVPTKTSESFFIQAVAIEKPTVSKKQYKIRIIIASSIVATGRNPKTITLKIRAVKNADIMPVTSSFLISTSKSIKAYI